MLQNKEAFGVLNSGPNTKEQINTFATSIITNIEDGEIDPLDVAVQIKMMEDSIKLIKGSEIYKDSLLTEATKYGEKENHYKGVMFSVKETGTRFDYKGCDYSKYEEALKTKAEIEKMLKALSGPMVDPDTGEEINPPVKRSTTAVVFSLK